MSKMLESLESDVSSVNLLSTMVPWRRNNNYRSTVCQPWYRGDGIIKFVFG